MWGTAASDPRKFSLSRRPVNLLVPAVGKPHDSPRRDSVLEVLTVSRLQAEANLPGDHERRHRTENDEDLEEVIQAFDRQVEGDGEQVRAACDRKRPEEDDAATPAPVRVGASRGRSGDDAR
jgi:hypothetical protein